KEVEDEPLEALIGAGPRRLSRPLRLDCDCHVPLLRSVTHQPLARNGPCGLRSGGQKGAGGEGGGEEEWGLRQGAAHGGGGKAGGGVGVEVDGSGREAVVAGGGGTLEVGAGLSGAFDLAFGDGDLNRGEEKFEQGVGVVAEVEVAFAGVGTR